MKKHKAEQEDTSLRDALLRVKTVKEIRQAIKTTRSENPWRISIRFMGYQRWKDQFTHDRELLKKLEAMFADKKSNHILNDDDAYALVKFLSDIPWEYSSGNFDHYLISPLLKHMDSWSSLEFIKILINNELLTPDNVRNIYKKKIVAAVAGTPILKQADLNMMLEKPRNAEYIAVFVNKFAKEKKQLNAESRVLISNMPAQMNKMFMNFLPIIGWEGFNCRDEQNKKEKKYHWLSANHILQIAKHPGLEGIIFLLFPRNLFTQKNLEQVLQHARIFEKRKLQKIFKSFNTYDCLYGTYYNPWFTQKVFDKLIKTINTAENPQNTAIDYLLEQQVRTDMKNKLDEADFEGAEDLIKNGIQSHRFTLFGANESSSSTSNSNSNSYSTNSFFETSNSEVTSAGKKPHYRGRIFLASNSSSNDNPPAYEEVYRQSR